MVELVRRVNRVRGEVRRLRTTFGEGGWLELWGRKKEKCKMEVGGKEYEGREKKRVK